MPRDPRPERERVVLQPRCPQRLWDQNLPDGEWRGRGAPGEAPVVTTSLGPVPAVSGQGDLLGKLQWEPAAERGFGVIQINSYKRARLGAYLSSPAPVGFCWQSPGSPVRNGRAAGANARGCCEPLAEPSPWRSKQHIVRIQQRPVSFQA